MRLLTVNYALANSEIDNHSIFNAPPIFDYPAVVVDPAGVSRAIDEAVAGGEYRTFGGLPVKDGLSTATEASIADILKQRREEVIRHLQRGGTILTFAYPNILHPRVTGFSGCDRYFWLPSPAGFAFREPFLLGTDGGAVSTVDPTHPASTILLTHEKEAGYRAYFDEDAPGFAEVGHVLARSPGGAATACEFTILGGRVIFLPALEKIVPGQKRFGLANEFLAVAKRLVTGAPAEGEPPWVEDHALPGIDARRRELEQAGTTVEAAISERDAISDELEQLARYRALLWAEGYQLEEAVRSAFRLLGFEVRGEPGRPADVTADGVPAVLEVEGAREDIGDEGFRRLSRKIEDDLLATGEGKKGILVVNGHRLADAGDRPKGYDDRLVAAAEFQGFAIVPSVHLFRLVQLTLEKRADPAELREALVASEGVFVPGELALPAGARADE